MKRIIIHWTAGTNKPCATDLEYYHYLVTGTGEVKNGKYKPEDNENCNDGKYAAHTGGGNTGSIGVAMCGMYVPSKVDIKRTEYPLTKVQCERTFKLCADLCKKYNIPITTYGVMTHYEFGKANPKTSSAGKIDIIYLSPWQEVAPAKIGDFIRNKIKWYYKNS
jgi:N-acetyl-anhydromuramyl-L-alanine amidase AmpD|nr:MAG TPA: N-acetylmuramoyl-L-alanine amidase [Caudoviricetes sp.]